MVRISSTRRWALNVQGAPRFACASCTRNRHRSAPVLLRSRASHMSSRRADSHAIMPRSRMAALYCEGETNIERVHKLSGMIRGRPAGPAWSQVPCGSSGSRPLATQRLKYRRDSASASHNTNQCRTGGHLNTLPGITDLSELGTQSCLPTARRACDCDPGFQPILTRHRQRLYPFC